VLKTLEKRIVTTVYCHNFLSLSPGSEHWQSPRLHLERGKTTSRNWCWSKNWQDHPAPMPVGASTQSLMTGFGKAADDDFTVTNSKTGFGERIRADQPIAKINMWSISTTYSLEPYIAIALKPGETKRWTYTYDLFGPGEEKK
jgi:hypothetical protein